MKLTKADSIIFHASGLERGLLQYRNHYCTSAKDPDLLDLVAKKLMTGPHSSSLLPDGEAYFHLTEAGVDRAWRIKRGEHGY